SQKSAAEAASAARPAVRASVATAMGNFMSPPFPLTKDVKPVKPPSPIQRLGEGWWRGASHFWKVASRAVRRLPDHTRRTLRTPAAVSGFYVRARRLVLTHPVRQKLP